MAEVQNLSRFMLTAMIKNDFPIKSSLSSWVCNVFSLVQLWLLLLLLYKQMFYLQNIISYVVVKKFGQTPVPFPKILLPWLKTSIFTRISFKRDCWFMVTWLLNQCYAKLPEFYEPAIGNTVCSWLVLRSLSSQMQFSKI